MRSLITRTRSLPAAHLQVVLGVSLTVLIAVAALTVVSLASSPEPGPDSETAAANDATTTATDPSPGDDRQDGTETRQPSGTRANTSDTRPDGDRDSGQSQPTSGGGDSEESSAAPGTGQVIFPEPHDNTPGVEPGEPVSSTLTHDPAAAGVPSDYFPPGVPAPAAPYDPNLGYSVGTGCAAKCITSGVAYANGPGADIEVTTNTSARIWIVVWNDLGTYMEDSGSKVTSFSATFDELQPDTFYYAMAVAEDANGYADHAYGSFTTLERQIKVSFDTGQLLSVPNGTLTGALDVDVWLNGEYRSDAWDNGIAPFGGIHDTVDLRIRVVAHHPQGQCVGQPPSGSAFPPYNGQATGCYTWVMLGSWDAAGNPDPVSVLHDDAVVETNTYRKVERTLTVNPTHNSALDAIVTMSVEIVYV